MVYTVQVTFLFKLTAGACPKSYGPSVARAAGIPSSIAERAVAISQQFEAAQAAPESGAGNDAELAEFRAAWRSLPDSQG